MTEATFVTKLCDILIDLKIIEPSEATVLAHSFHDSDADQFDEFLISEGLVHDADLLNALSRYYQVPSFDVVSHFFEGQELHKFPKEFLLQNRIIPLEDDENTLVMVAADPGDANLLSEIGTYVSYDIQFRVGLGRAICDAVKEFYDSSLTEGVADNLYDEPEHKDVENADLEDAERLDEDLVYEEDFESDYE